MRKRFSWLAALVVFGFIWAPDAAHGQQPEMPSASGVYWPFGPDHLEQGGFYIAGQFVYFAQTNPMKEQQVAYRGIQDADGTIGAAIGLGNTPGQWIGSKVVALDTSQLSGPNTYTPGFSLNLGYRFQDGWVIDTRWIHLVDARYSATAGLLPPTPIGGSAQETFVSSPVYNFTPPYFGPGNTLGVGSSTAVFGLWDGDSQQTISFVQRFDQWELTGRIPITDEECWRTYGLVGPRLVSMWERFTWTVVRQELDGSSEPEDSASYTNVVSNRLYGVHAGVGNEWFLGDTRCGAFAISLDTQGALFVDLMKGRPKYELGDHSTAAQHGIDLISIVPEADGQLNFTWYPYHGIEVRIGYEGMVFFNTYSSPRPIDFNFGSITPAYSSTIRTMQGFTLGLGFVF